MPQIAKIWGLRPGSPVARMDVGAGKAIACVLSVRISIAGRGVSFQITILKVLAGHPEGHASLADLTRYVAVLTSSGADWSQRMKRLAARAPNLDIFTSGFVLREDTGWRVTDAGRAFLVSIEAPAQPPAAVASETVELKPAAVVLPDPNGNVIQLFSYKGRRAAA